MNEELNDLNRTLAHLKKVSDIKECFYHKQNECEGKIKNAHSISRGNRLDLIKGLVNNNDKVYSLAEISIEDGVVRKGIKDVGWGKVASTFYGFCDKHDTELFEPIENNHDFDNSSKHCFLHSYRSFAYTYHNVKRTIKLTGHGLDYILESEKTLPLDELARSREALKLALDKMEAENGSFPKEQLIKMMNEVLIPKIEKTFKPFGKVKTEAAIAQAQVNVSKINSFKDIITLFDVSLSQHKTLQSLAIEGKRRLSATKEELEAEGLHSWLVWMNEYKDKLDYMIENHAYEGLKYYCRVKNYLFPFACAFAFSPDFLYSGMDNFIIPPSDPQKILNACLMVTVLPDRSGKTIILFSCFKEDRQSEFFLNKLFSLKNENEFERAVTSMIINRHSNVFLGPSMWNKLGTRQHILEKEINVLRPTDELPEKPFMSKINFFDPEFSVSVDTLIEM